MQMYNITGEEGEKQERIKHCSACSEIHTIVRHLPCEHEKKGFKKKKYNFY